MDATPSASRNEADPTRSHVTEDLNKSETGSETSTPPSSGQTETEEHSDKTGSGEQDRHESEMSPEAKADIEEAKESTPTPQKEEEPIPSFMEWTQIQQQKLHDSNIAHAQAVTNSGQTNGHNGHKSSNTASSQQNQSAQTGIDASSTKNRKESNAKNFASPDCGAKVIQSNPESQNSNGVLSSSHDEYMLNKCGIAIWFVIELCEPLKIEKVSLGNLELFSSSPKDVEIGISDRYPTREWSKMGPFTLPDIRAIHSIVLPATNASTFGKFLKVNILSHYGAEHFCPLSLVRVNGISEYEVLESENTHPEEIDAAEKEESALYEEPVGDQTTTEGHPSADKSVFGSAKDAVINIVKKAAQVLVKSEHSKDASQHGSVGSHSSCRSMLQCLPNYELQIRERVLSFLSCNFSDLLPFLSKNSPWCGWDYCHAMFNKQSIGLPWQPEGFYASIFGGHSVLHALCNYHRPLSKESCDSLLLPNASTISAQDGILTEGYTNESLKSPPVLVGTHPDESKDKENILPVQNSHASNGQVDNKDAELLKPSVEATSTGQATEPAQTPQLPKENAATSTVPSPNGENQQHTAVPSSSPSNGAPVISTGTVEETNIPVPVPPQNQPPQQQQQANVQQQQQKESVFVRLSNRIKTLERNQSLTASYLEELSRRFKKQNEENYHFNEGSKRFMNESRVKFRTLEDIYKFELRSLRRNTDEIRERLFNVQLQRSVLILLCIIQLMGILFICGWVRRRFRQFELQLRDMPRRQSSSALVPVTSHIRRSSSCLEGSQHSIVHGRKRINSEASIGSSLNSFDTSKKIKKKKKKLADLKPANIMSSGPASAPLEYPSTSAEGAFRFDHRASSRSAYDVILANFKENVKPEPKTKTEYVPDIKPITFGGEHNFMSFGNPSGGGSQLSTKVDSPFAMISSATPNFYMEPGVSTSSRFALLSSPGPGAVGKPSTLQRSGSLTSLDDRSSLSSYSDKTGSHSIVNGHGDSQSQHSNGSGKKRKNKGLKAFMPKIFDR